ncbi:TM0106 family RecB-like putative nuclease [Modestobacter sp. I12A-02628]|uniref:TM0106 family RecB-like putative nuclease n=1 Tax=Goekera deserti TaxID=2497753 RepID=A0A7K3WL95_9ACTN|nr:TM0106 family RecB-like putative nuclease [Goekera deserti]MPQ96631.1 TM0106 family RecB-like putative nuclease [Goekera deserti]NDI47057.1 TM0106 family RecB-like putative nuclease [Goekera deserti]NEL56293.1 TM0106 family RecB-like putative nuclease [Goekera deserti]
MYESDGALVVSAGDLTGFLECEHLTRLSTEVARGLRPRPPAADPMTQLVAEHGIAHEARHVQRLRDAGLSVVEIDAPTGKDAAALLRAQAETLAAMRSGADVVYQATFFDGTWRGHADFLLKRPDRDSALGPWAYDVADTKLARRIKVPALLQMALYGDLLAVLQGAPPELLTVVTGDRQELTFRYADAQAYARTARTRFLDRLADGDLAPPHPNAHCGVCPWKATCTERWTAEDHLSRVAFLRRDHAVALTGVGISTVAQLARVPADRLPESIGHTSRERITRQARLQVAERETGVPGYEFLPRLPGRGFELLPPPSRGDLFFDIEGDPFTGDHGLEYLWGLLDTTGAFTAYWGCEPGDPAAPAPDQSAAERRAFEQLVDHLVAAHAADPAMHVYHYAPYEPNRLRDLSARLHTRQAEVDRLLRGDVLVDLYAVVRQGLLLSKESYSLKKVEDHYRGHTRPVAETVSDAGASIIAFETWLATREQRLLDEIETYNRDDCLSTMQLRDWLEALRTELLATGTPLARPGDADPEASLEALAAEAARADLERRLLTGVPADAADRSPEQQAVWLLAQQLGWHAREARSEWWEYFRLRALPAEDLERESVALGPLEPVAMLGVQGRSAHWRYRFPPQETKVGPGDRLDHVPVGADGRRVSSEVVDVDATEGWVVLSRRVEVSAEHPLGLLPGGPIPDTVFRAALLDLGEAVAAGGVDAPGRHLRAARDLLLHRPPRLRDGEPVVVPGEPAGDAVRRLARALDGGVLAVQGPPGAGKTHTGARAVVDLVRAGRRVGITAHSHKALGNLLDGVVAAAGEAGVPLRAVQKAAPHQMCSAPGVVCAGTNGAVVDALDAGDADLVAGTPWLFARPELAGRLDVLVVDEAGQLSLANTLVVSRAATDLLLLGDPQQLRQPGRGVHADGADVSALQHVIGADDVLPPGRGVFLDRTWRMAPALCGLVSELSYDSRLLPAPVTAGNAIDLPDRWAAPSGLGWVPVVHEGNGAASAEEAAVVVELVGDLLGRAWRTAAGEHRMTQADVLVVTPYNAQVNRVRSALAAAGLADVEVGTVDRFQGREAAVSIFTLAASSGAHVPRRLEFLLDRHRLNVALSRAKTVAFLVGSPALLTSPVHTPEQLRLVNGLCRLVERATGAAFLQVG